MDKKLTTTLGIAVGASLLAGAGYGIYKYFSGKKEKATGDGLSDTNHTSNLFSDFIGNSLVKSNSLYGGADNGLIGGGLYKGNNLVAFV